MLIVVFCEILPKNVALARKEGVLLFCLPFLRLLCFVMMGAGTGMDANGNGNMAELSEEFPLYPDFADPWAN